MHIFKKGDKIKFKKNITHYMYNDWLGNLTNTGTITECVHEMGWGHPGICFDYRVEWDGGENNTSQVQEKDIMLVKPEPIELAGIVEFWKRTGIIKRKRGRPRKVSGFDMTKKGVLVK